MKTNNRTSLWLVLGRAFRKYGVCEKWMAYFQNSPLSTRHHLYSQKPRSGLVTCWRSEFPCANFRWTQWKRFWIVPTKVLQNRWNSLMTQMAKRLFAPQNESIHLSMWSKVERGFHSYLTVRKVPRYAWSCYILREHLYITRALFLSGKTFIHRCAFKENSF